MAFVIIFTNDIRLSSDQVYLSFGVPAGKTDPLNTRDIMTFLSKAVQT